MEEVFDIFTKNYNWLGTATRDEVHRKGYWHQTFHCWVVHQTELGPFLLLQLRHPSKDTHPNKLDISCAGHLQADETPADGIRELEEELGLTVAFRELYSAGIYTYSDQDGEVQDNEFCHLFVYSNKEEGLVGYAPQLDEISGLFLVDLREFKTLVLGECESIQIKGFTLSEGRREGMERLMTLTDLVKNEPNYYEQLFDCLERNELSEGGIYDDFFKG